MGLPITEEKTLAQLKNSLLVLLGNSLAAIRLYGSRARGDFDERSDIDIAVIVRGLTRQARNRILEKTAEIELENLMPLSVLVLSEEEFENLKRRERRIALDIEREGIPL
ncbi:MAG: nucleotidyltransferase domain-containing protein [Nitrospiraceae bacterium]|nr:nucleotidyltransferase domain-containing protein [Nitrospiraceae bacterium]